LVEADLAEDGSVPPLVDDPFSPAEQARPAVADSLQDERARGARFPGGWVEADWAVADWIPLKAGGHFWPAERRGWMAAVD